MSFIYPTDQLSLIDAILSHQDTAAYSTKKAAHTALTDLGLFYGHIHSTDFYYGKIDERYVYVELDSHISNIAEIFYIASKNWGVLDLKLIPHKANINYNHLVVNHDEKMPCYYYYTLHGRLNQLAYFIKGERRNHDNLHWLELYDPDGQFTECYEPQSLNYINVDSITYRDREVINAQFTLEFGAVDLELINKIFNFSVKFNKDKILHITDYISREHVDIIEMYQK